MEGLSLVLDPMVILYEKKNYEVSLFPIPISLEPDVVNNRIFQSQVFII